MNVKTTSPDLWALVDLAKHKPTDARVQAFYEVVQTGGVTPEKQAIVAALLHGPKSPQTEKFVLASTDPTYTRTLLPRRAQRVDPAVVRNLKHLLSATAPVLAGALADAIRVRATKALPGLPVAAVPPRLKEWGVRIPLSRDYGPGVQRFVHFDRDTSEFYVVEQPLVLRGRLWLPDSSKTTFRGPGHLALPSDVLWGSKPFKG